MWTAIGLAGLCQGEPDLISFPVMSFFSRRYEMRSCHVPQYSGLAKCIAKTIGCAINPKYWGNAGRLDKPTDMSPFGKEHDLRVAWLLFGSKPYGYRSAMPRRGVKLELLRYG